MTDEQIRTEDCRWEVLEALYSRRQGAHQATTICTVFLSRRDYTLKEVETALSDMQRFHWVTCAPEHPKSSIIVWQIDGDGIVEIERRRSRRG